MKKFLPILILVNLVILALPQVSLAAIEPTTPSECCKLGRDINWSSGMVNNVSCVGTPAPCQLKKDDTVGETGVVCPQTNLAPIRRATEWGMVCLINTLYNITDWIFTILIILSGIMVILGAFNLITSTGEPAKVTSGRNYILYAAIGLAIAFLAKAIPGIAGVIVGV